MQQLFRFINLFKSAQHVSGDKSAHPQEHFLTVYTAFRYNAPTLRVGTAKLYSGETQDSAGDNKSFDKHVSYIMKLANLMFV